MNKKILISIILLTMFLAVSAVSAAENVTDEADSTPSVGEVAEDEVVTTGDVDCGPATGAADSDLVASADEDAQAAPEPSKPLTLDDSAKATSDISASKVTGYTSFYTKFTVKLTVDGKKASDRKVKITVNKDSYDRYTDANGEAVLSIKLAKGTYDVKFSYGGDGNTTSSSGTSKITVKQATKTYLKVADKQINYRQGLKSLFYVKLTDAKGNPIKSQTVTFKVKGKKYTATTTSYGNAKIYLSLKKGSHRVYYSFAKTSPYLSSSGSFKIKVKSAMAKGNGYWMWPSSMKSTSLKALSKKGTKHIFLESTAISAYGKSYVKSWIKKAHRYGIKVHIWMLVCSDGNDWVSPVRSDGSFKHGFINQKVRQAVSYAKMSGVDGVHLDYMRYGGTAHKHINAVKSINYIVKKISTKVHKAKARCIVSVALMPEPKAMHYYYGQDVPTLSRYADALLPMVYKGNYGKNTKWIKSVTQTFAKQSNGAQIWTGLQTYKSDNDPTVLSYSSLLKDARASMEGGAKGVVLFRIGLTHYLNFNKV